MDVKHQLTCSVREILGISSSGFIWARRYSLASSQQSQSTGETKKRYISMRSCEWWLVWQFVIVSVYRLYGCCCSKSDIILFSLPDSFTVVSSSHSVVEHTLFLCDLSQPSFHISTETCKCLFYQEWPPTSIYSDSS